MTNEKVAPILPVLQKDKFSNSFIQTPNFQINTAVLINWPTSILNSKHFRIKAL